MGYYCTVPQCTSLAGKTKNVKFHRFPRDVIMADKWNIILKRGKPYTKYSKVCSLHFTQADYNVTTMGQWKTLSKDAVPSQNLPKLNPDGTVMVIRKSRTVKYKENRKDDIVSDKSDKWSPMTMNVHHQSNPLPPPNTSIADTTVHSSDPQDNLTYRLQTLNAIANHLTRPHSIRTEAQSIGLNTTPISVTIKPKKQDAIMQTDPLQTEEDENPAHSHSDTSENTFNSEQLESYSVSSQYQKTTDNYDPHNKNFDMPKDYTKSNDDYIPQTNEEYNKEAEKYALERKSTSSHSSYDKPVIEAYSKSVPIENGYQKPVGIENGYPKLPEVYSGYDDKEFQNRNESYIGYQNGYPDSADILRNQQHNLQILQEQHRVTENQNFFNENHIKQEIDLGTEEEKFIYERTKEQLDGSTVYSEGERRLLQQQHQQRLLEQLQHQLKQEPDAAASCDSAMQPQGSPYYPNGNSNVPGYYEQVRPGPELLIAKQNALAAHTQLWQNTMKRPFFYSENSHYNPPPILHRYEDIPRILQ